MEDSSRRPHDKDRLYDEAVRTLFDSDLSHDVSRDTLITLLTEVGIGERLAGHMADDALFDLKAQPIGFATNDVRVALTAAIGALAFLLPALWFERLLEEHPELRQPPTEEPPVTIPGVGVVHRGRTRVTTTTLPRDFFRIWLQRDPNADCPEFRWYQFVRPKLFVNGVDTECDDTFTPATELETTFGKWNPDYHVDEAKRDDRERRRAGLPKNPEFTPDLPPDTPGGEPPEVEPGKPHVEAPVPGAHGVTGATSTGPRGHGVLDSPNLTERPKPDKPSQIEQSWFDNTPSHHTGEAPPEPSEGTDLVEIRVEIRTYLICIRDGEAECIGYVEWTHTSSARLRWGWERDYSDVPELGVVTAADRKWKRKVLSAEYGLTQTYGDWHPC